jgi:predicted DNA-binding transcriptional regulator AlpA
VAALLGVNEQTVRLWIKAGKFPAPLACGRRVFLWPRPVIDRVLAERREFKK